MARKTPEEVAQSSGSVGTGAVQEKNRGPAPALRVVSSSEAMVRRSNIPGPYGPVDRLRAARGLLLGLAISLCLWLAAGVAYWVLFR